LFSEKTMAKQKVLVVDDEEDILELLRFNLTKEGFGGCAASGRSLKLTRLEGGCDPPRSFTAGHGRSGSGQAPQSDASTRDPRHHGDGQGKEADIGGLKVGAETTSRNLSARVLIARARAVLRRKASVPPMIRRWVVCDLVIVWSAQRFS
jgi:two-component system phosphate regulon response regulator PhoB